MSVRKILLWMLLIDFTLFTGWVLWEVGYLGIWQAGFDSPGGLQILIDLVIMCVLFLSWMIRDAKAKGVNPWPWCVATLFLGSIVPLTYLLVREYRWKSTSSNQGVAPAAMAS